MCSRMNDTYGIHPEGFFEVAIESWSEWDWISSPLNSVQTLQPTELSGHKINPTIRANFVQLLQFHCLFRGKFQFSCCLHQSPRLF